VKAYADTVDFFGGRGAPEGERVRGDADDRAWEARCWKDVDMREGQRGRYRISFGHRHRRSTCGVERAIWTGTIPSVFGR